MTEKTPSTISEWKGYTLEELMYRRDITGIRIDVEKERISNEYSRFSRGNMMLSKSLFMHMVSVMGYADFIVLGFKLWRRFAPLFKKKK